MSFTSCINFGSVAKTKFSGAMCGSRPHISDLGPLDIMSYYSQGIMWSDSYAASLTSAASETSIASTTLKILFHQKKLADLDMLHFEVPDGQHKLT
jgi:hypothetical protein